MPRPAKSATLQLIQGNPNKKNTDELAARAEHEKKIKMRSDNIKAPPWLNKVAKKEFKRVAALLSEVEIITEADIACWPPIVMHTLSIFRFQKSLKKMGSWCIPRDMMRMEILFS